MVLAPHDHLHIKQIRMLRLRCSAGVGLTRVEGHSDVYGLAWAVGVVYDSPRTTVHVDQAVKEFQPAALFMVRGGWPTDWSASSVVVDLGSEMVAGVRQADVDRACVT